MYDLHVHTLVSDGDDSTAKIADAAISGKARVIAVTDHDIVNREARPLIQKYHGQFEKITQHKAPWIDVAEGVEVSICHTDDDYNKSMHMLAYSARLPASLDPFLQKIRDGKLQKIKLQCETLSSHGFQIQLKGGNLVPFSLENLQNRFPKSNGESLNNGHIAKSFLELDSNAILASKITGESIDKTNFMTQCLKKEGKYTRKISLPHDVPPYEPSFESLIAELDRNKTVISLPHAHVTFATVDEFHSRIGKLVDIGMNAIEISTTMPAEWVQVVDQTSKKYDLLLTFGSDSHGIGKIDAYHGEFMTLNPVLKGSEAIVGDWMEVFLRKTGVVV